MRSLEATPAGVRVVVSYDHDIDAASEALLAVLRRPDSNPAQDDERESEAAEEAA